MNSTFMLFQHCFAISFSCQGSHTFSAGNAIFLCFSTLEFELRRNELVADRTVIKKTRVRRHPGRTESKNKYRIFSNNNGRGANQKTVRLNSKIWPNKLNKVSNKIYFLRIKGSIGSMCDLYLKVHWSDHKFHMVWNQQWGWHRWVSAIIASLCVGSK